MLVYMQSHIKAPYMDLEGSGKLDLLELYLFSWNACTEGKDAIASAMSIFLRRWQKAFRLR